MPKPRREIAPTIVIDNCGHLLLQRRDDIPGILYPGKIGLFGGHREGNETFLECAVRELHEELSHYLPPDRFEYLASLEGPDSEVPGGTVRADFFIVRNVAVEDLRITEGQLHEIAFAELQAVEQELTPTARYALNEFSKRRG